MFSVFQLFRVLQSLLLMAGTLLCLCVQKDVAPADSGCASVKRDCPELLVCSCPLSAGCAMLPFGLPDQLPQITFIMI